MPSQKKCKAKRRLLVNLAHKSNNNENKKELIKIYCKEGKLDEIKKIILITNIDISQIYEESLKNACIGGHVDIVDYLYNMHNNDANIKAFIEACINGHKNIIDFFIKKSKQNKMPLNGACFIALTKCKVAEIYMFEYFYKQLPPLFIGSYEECFKNILIHINDLEVVKYYYKHNMVKITTDMFNILFNLNKWDIIKYFTTITDISISSNTIQNKFIAMCTNCDLNMIQYICSYYKKYNVKPLSNILDGIIMLCHSHPNSYACLNYLTSISLYDTNYKIISIENNFSYTNNDYEPFFILQYKNEVLLYQVFKINYYFQVAFKNNNFQAMLFLIKLYKKRINNIKVYNPVSEFIFPVVKINKNIYYLLHQIGSPYKYKKSLLL